MTQLARRLAASGLIALVIALLGSGAAEARIVVNHKENVR